MRELKIAVSCILLSAVICLAEGHNEIPPNVQQGGLPSSQIADSEGTTLVSLTSTISTTTSLRSSVSSHGHSTAEQLDHPATWPWKTSPMSPTTLEIATWPWDKTSSSILKVATLRTPVDPWDALFDSEEFTSPTPIVFTKDEDYVLKTTRKPTKKTLRLIQSNLRVALTDDQLVKHPFVYGCCVNSTYVGCAGVCPTTCEYRSRYCVPLCGAPCRCKRGYVYNIQARACTLRRDCPKGLKQSHYGVYRVFL